MSTERRPRMGEQGWTWGAANLPVEIIADQPDGYGAIVVKYRNRPSGEACYATARLTDLSPPKLTVREVIDRTFPLLPRETRRVIVEVVEAEFPETRR